MPFFTARSRTEVSARGILATNAEAMVLVQQLGKPSQDRSRRDFAVTCELLRLGLTKEEMFAFPHALIGSPEAICDELQSRRERYGISYVTVGDNVLEEFAPVVAKLAGC